MKVGPAAGAAAVAATLILVSACARYDSEPSSGPSAGGGPAAPGPSAVPAALAVPPNHRLVVTMTVAQGSQVYACTNGSWTLREPDAVLSSPIGDALHTAGPRWIAIIDGSAVTGAQVASAPVADAVPALLLRATAHQGVGVFSPVDFVQRLNTRGGLAPSGPCSPGQERAVGYSADYRFWAPQ